MKSSKKKIAPPPMLKEPVLAEALRRSAVDVLLCFFAVVLTTMAFLKFFRSDV